MEFLSHYTRQTGVPRAFAIVGRNKIEFTPVPDRAYRVTVRYTPPVKEF